MTNMSVPYSFTPDDMVIYQVYMSSGNQKLVATGLDPKKYGCDGPMPPEWQDNWFLIDGDTMDFLDQELTLIEAGDYDNDGKTELLFWHSGYNEDGYILMYNSFTQKAEFLWSYH